MCVCVCVCVCVRERVCVFSYEGSQIDCSGSSSPDNRNFADKAAQARQPRRLLKICLHRDKDGEGRPFNRTDLPLASRSLNLETYIYWTDACLVQGCSFSFLDVLLRCDPALEHQDIIM